MSPKGLRPLAVKKSTELGMTYSTALNINTGKEITVCAMHR
jgi:hypothetical protein